MKSKEKSHLIKYIVEVAEGVKSPMTLNEVAKNYKERSKLPETMNCLAKRIKRVRAKFHTFDHIDIHVTARVLFALNGQVHPSFLKKLQAVATVKLDGEHRIAHYKSNDGSVEIQIDGPPPPKVRPLNPKRIVDFFNGKDCNDDTEIRDMVNFINTKCDDVTSPLSLNRLAEDFVRLLNPSTRITTLKKRFSIYRREIQKVSNMELTSKVKQLFGLSAELTPECLAELQENAFVEVDGRKRITKYVPNDGKLKLEGAHWEPGKSGKTTTSMRKNRKKSQICNDSGNIKDESDEDVEAEEEFDDDSEDEDEDEDTDEDEENDSEAGDTTQEMKTVMTRSGRISKKVLNDPLTPTNTTSNSNSSRKRRQPNRNVLGSQAKKRSQTTFNDIDDIDMDINASQHNDLVGLDEYLQDAPPNRVEVPVPAQEPVVPNENVMEEDEHIITNKFDPEKVKQEHPSEMIQPKQDPDLFGVGDKNSNSRLKVIRALHLVVRTFNMPALKAFEEELAEQNRLGYKKIENNVLVPALNLCIAMITNNDDNPPSDENSVYVRDFLSNLRMAMISSDFEGLDDFMKKLNLNIRNMRLEKRVTAEKLLEVLQLTHNIIAR